MNEDRLLRTEKSRDRNCSLLNDSVCSSFWLRQADASAAGRVRTPRLAPDVQGRPGVHAAPTGPRVRRSQTSHLPAFQPFTWHWCRPLTCVCVLFSRHRSLPSRVRRSLSSCLL